MKKIAHYRFTLFLLAAAFVITLPSSAMAQKFLENYKTPMPDIPLMPDADFAKQATDQQDMPMGDRALGYSIKIPNGWQKNVDQTASSSNLGTKILGELVRFYGPAEMDYRSYVRVQAVKLDYQLTAEQWFVQWLLSNSYTVQGFKTHDSKRAEALYVSNQGDATYIVRSVAQINGTRVLLAEYFLPTDRWEKEKQLQAQVISSFHVVYPVTEYAEPMEQYHFLDIAEFDYPKSWELRTEPLTSIDRLEVEMLSVADEKEIKKTMYKLLKGKIQMDLIAYYAVDNVKQEFKNYKKRLEDSGIAVDDLVEVLKDFSIHKDFKAKPVEVYKVRDTQNDSMSYELWLLVMEAGDYYYFVSLLTPSRDDDYRLWARNTQTFRVVTSTIVPQANSLTGN